MQGSLQGISIERVEHPFGTGSIDRSVGINTCFRTLIRDLLYQDKNVEIAAHHSNHEPPVQILHTNGGVQNVCYGRLLLSGQSLAFRHNLTGVLKLVQVEQTKVPKKEAEQMRLPSSSHQRPVRCARFSLLAGALAFAGFFAPAPNSCALADEPLTWNREVNKSLDQAKADHKYVLADVYTDWCGWCKRLDKDTFSNEGVKSYLNGKFVCIKVNAEDKGEGTKLTKKYKVNGFPCALVFDTSGKYIGKISGFRPPDEYQTELTRLIENPPAVPEM